jgi:hypothetical protein
LIGYERFQLLLRGHYNSNLLLIEIIPLLMQAKRTPVELHIARPSSAASGKNTENTIYAVFALLKVSTVHD